MEYTVNSAVFGPLGDGKRHAVPASGNTYSITITVPANAKPGAGGVTLVDMYMIGNCGVLGIYSATAQWGPFTIGKGLLGGPNAKIGPREYSPFEKLAKTLILDDYECLKAYSDTCTTEQAYELAAWYVLSIPLGELGGKFVLKPLWAVVGPELRALLEKYGPKIAEGSKVALAEFRVQLARLIPTAITRLPPERRLQALNSLTGVLKHMPEDVQRELVKMRFLEVLKPNDKWIGSYDSKNAILTVKNPSQLASIYKQLKLGAEPANSVKPYADGQLMKFPSGGTVGLKNKAELPGPRSPNSVGPSIDIKIPGLEIKVKPVTHAK